MAAGNVYPDPGIAFGQFRVLPRTDGGFCVVDTRRDPGHQTVGHKFQKLDEARLAAEALHKAEEQ